MERGTAKERDAAQTVYTSNNQNGLQSHMDVNPTSPLGREWFREIPFPTPFFPFGEGFTPPPTPSPRPGRGGREG